jgi:hypothetical protein
MMRDRPGRYRPGKGGAAAVAAETAKLSAASDPAAAVAVAGPQGRGSAEWMEIVLGIQARLGDAEKALAALEAQRRPHVLPATMGIPEAITKLAELDGRRPELRDALDTLRDALVDAQAQYAAACDAEAAARCAARRAEAEGLAVEIVAAAAEVDRRLAALAEAFQREEDLRRRLLRTGQWSAKADDVLRVYARCRDGAMVHAGLRRFLPMPALDRVHHRSRASWADEALNGLLDPARPRPPRPVVALPASDLPALPYDAMNALANAQAMAGEREARAREKAANLEREARDAERRVQDHRIWALENGALSPLAATAAVAVAEPEDVSDAEAFAHMALREVP